MNYKVSTLAYFLLVAIIAVSMVSCDPNEPMTPNDIVPGPVVSMSSYPLDAGNEWTYAMTVDVTGDFPDFFEYVLEFDVISDTTIEGVPVGKIRSTETEGQTAGNSRLGYRYLGHTDFGLEMLAYQGPATQVYLRLAEELQIPNYSFISINQSVDSVAVLDSSIYYMKFSSVDGESWASNEFGATSGASFKRKWSGYYTVTTPAGTFDCIRLDLFGDQDNDGQPDENSVYIQQYISPEFGLIKEIDTRELNWTGGTGTYLREATLTSVNVQ